jgi:hypothetical protein
MFMKSSPTFVATKNSSGTLHKPLCTDELDAGWQMPDLIVGFLTLSIKEKPYVYA